MFLCFRCRSSSLFAPIRCTDHNVIEKLSKTSTIHAQFYIFCARDGCAFQPSRLPHSTDVAYVRKKKHRLFQIFSIAGCHLMRCVRVAAFESAHRIHRQGGIVAQRRRDTLMEDEIQDACMIACTECREREQRIDDVECGRPSSHCLWRFPSYGVAVIFVRYVFSSNFFHLRSA